MFIDDWAICAIVWMLQVNGFMADVRHPATGSTRHRFSPKADSLCAGAQARTAMSLDQKPTLNIQGPAITIQSQLKDGFNPLEFDQLAFKIVAARAMKTGARG